MSLGSWNPTFIKNNSINNLWIFIFMILHKNCQNYYWKCANVYVSFRFVLQSKSTVQAALLIQSLGIYSFVNCRMENKTYFFEVFLVIFRVWNFIFSSYCKICRNMLWRNWNVSSHKIRIHWGPCYPYYQYRCRYWCRLTFSYSKSKEKLVSTDGESCKGVPIMVLVRIPKPQCIGILNCT